MVFKPKKKFNYLVKIFKKASPHPLLKIQESLNMQIFFISDI